MLKSPNTTATPAKKILLTLLGGAGVILLGGGAILFGLNSQLTGLQTVATQKEQEVGSSEQIAKRYQATLDSYNETQGRIQFLENAVTPKSYVPTLLKQLQTLALTTHLTVMSVRPAAPPPPAPPPMRSPDGSGPSPKAAAPPPYDVVPIDVDVTGTYADTATFLYDLTRFPKIIAVVGAQLHPGNIPAGADPTSSPTVTTNLHLIAFMFHDDADTPTLPGNATTAVAAAPVSGPSQPVDVSKIDPTAGRVERGALAASHAVNDRIDQGRAAAGNSAL